MIHDVNNNENARSSEGAIAYANRHPQNRKSTREIERERKNVDRLTAFELGNLVNQSQHALDCLASYFSEMKKKPKQCYVSFQATIERAIIDHESEVSHFQQAMREDDRDEFIKAMVK